MCFRGREDEDAGRLVAAHAARVQSWLTGAGSAQRTVSATPAAAPAVPTGAVLALGAVVPV